METDHEAEGRRGVVTAALGDRVPLTPQSPWQWVAASGMVLRTEVGSTVHQTAIAGSDDVDEMGVAVEPPHVVMGLSRKFETYTFRTAEPDGTLRPGEHPRSGPNDLDLVVYGLRHYCHHAAKGNATMVLPLWVPQDKVRYCTELGYELRGMRDAFVSREAGSAFLGYLHSQREGLLGNRSGARHQGRADIIAAHGFDTKFAMHMVRIGMQGVALLRDGVLPVPLPPDQLRYLQELRRGEHSKEDALAYAALLERQLDGLCETSKLPERADRARVSAWLVDVHARQWGWSRGRERAA